MANSSVFICFVPTFYILSILGFKICSGQQNDKGKKNTNKWKHKTEHRNPNTIY